MSLKINKTCNARNIYDDLTMSVRDQDDCSMDLIVLYSAFLLEFKIRTYAWKLNSIIQKQNRKETKT